jgi:hypothetical protein
LPQGTIKVELSEKQHQLIVNAEQAVAEATQHRQVVLETLAAAVEFTGDHSMAVQQIESKWYMILVPKPAKEA